MKKLLLLLIPLTVILLGGCSTQQNSCQKYAEGYCNASVGVAYNAVIVELGRNSEGFTNYVCRFACAEIILVEETENF